VNFSTGGAIMSNFSNPADVCAIYLAEFEQLDEKLRGLCERATQARREAKNKHTIYRAHASEV